MAFESVFLSSYGFNKCSQYKDAIELNFGISIDFPEVETSNLHSFLSNDVLIIQLNGPENSIKAASEHITSLVTPEECLPFYIPRGLKCVFKNITWLRILAKIYDVDIKIQTGIESLLVSGAKRDVTSALTAMTVLDCTFQNTVHEVETRHLNVLKVEIPSDMLLPPAVKHCYRSVQHLPLRVVELLLSWIKEALNYHNVQTVDISVITLEDSLLDQSVIILDTPPPPNPEMVDLITISDEETDNNVQGTVNMQGQNAINIQGQNTTSSQVQSLVNNQIQNTGNNKFPNTRRTNAKKRKNFPRDKHWVLPNSGAVRNPKQRKRARWQSDEANAGAQIPENANAVHKKAKLQNDEINVKASTSRKNPLADLMELHIANQNNMNFNKPFTSTTAGGSSDIIPFNPPQRTVILGPASQNITLPVPNANRVLRPIVIDGSNVARSHGEAEKIFSCKGIELCVNFFLSRGHKDVVAFVPQYRRKRHNQNIKGHDILEKLASSQHVAFTPSRTVKGKSISSYDDRFIVRLASENGGIIVSNDLYRDLMHENSEWTSTIEERLLMYCFVGDKFMIPDDPLGANGPRIDEFLSFPLSTPIS